MSGSYIVYKDIAPGAAEHGTAAAGNVTEDTRLPLLLTGIDAPAYAALEHDRWILDESFVLFPGEAAFWSSRMSGADGTFTEEPEITVSFSAQYSSVGVTLTFDTATGEYCSSVHIKWYQGDTLKSEKDFAPDLTQYFCENHVTGYDKVVITLKRTSIPGRRAKINRILFGVERVFYMDELRGVKLTNQTDLAALTLPVSKMTWKLDSRHDVNFMFQLKQPVESWSSGGLLGVYYIDSFSRSAANLYDIDCNDAIGVLDETAFPGGVYAGASAKWLIQEIVGSDFELEMGEVGDAALTGAIEAGSKRDAIRQVLFAWGVCLSTDGRHSLRLFTPPSEPKKIGPERTYQGASVETATIVTEVRVTAHTYAESETGSIEIDGKKYSDTKTVYAISNPDVAANDKQNMVEITNATLVSPGNAADVARRVYDFYLRRETNKSKFVWDGEHLGDRVTQPTPWGTETTGNLYKMTVTLSNTVAVASETI